MKYALLSDIHANVHAFTACLAHARAQGAQQFALLGDLVGYGGQPAAVVDMAMALAAQGASIVQGNHDAAVAAPAASIHLGAHLGAQSAQWTHDQLRAEQRAFLAQQPLTARLGPYAILVHASCDQPERWHYVQDGNAAERSLAAATAMDGQLRYVFCGHVHDQALYFLTPTAKLMRFSPQPGVAVPVPMHRQWLAVVGSVGQPRDGDSRAMYAIYDESACSLSFHRVDYDHSAAAAAIRATPLPAFFADRLDVGQ